MGIAKLAGIFTLRRIEGIMKIWKLLVLVLLTGVCYKSSASAAAAYVIMDAATGHVLAEGNGDQRLPVASLTKVATAMVALDWAETSKQDLSQAAVISQNAVSQGGVNPLGLQPGDQMALRDLIYASLMQSDNVAAYAIAEHVGQAFAPNVPVNVRELGPAGVFVNQMNALARSQGMAETTFLNPHGLDAAERRPPVSTAKDMALLTKYAMAKASFRFYVSQKEREVRINRMGQDLGFLLKNTNTLVGTDRIDGVKTGRTTRAGDCLILSAEREPLTRKEGDTIFLTQRRIIVVLLNSPDRFGEGRAMMQRGWQMHEQWLVSTGQAPATGQPVQQ